MGIENNDDTSANAIEKKPETIKEFLERESRYARNLNGQRLVTSAIENVGLKIVAIIAEKR